MMKREPGFMGLAKQNAKKKPISKEQQQFRQEIGQKMQADRAQEQGMVDKMSAFNRMQQDKQRMMEAPKEYEPSQGGETETLAYLNPKEMQMLKRAGGSGEMTEYGIPSFGARDENKGKHGSGENRREKQTRQTGSGVNRSDSKLGNVARGGGFSHGGPGSDEGAVANTGGGSTPNRGYVAPESGGGGGGGGGFTPPPAKTPAQIEAERKATAKGKYDEEGKKRKEGQQGKTWDRERKSAVRGTMKDAQGRTEDQQGVMTDASGKVEGDEGFDFESATLQGGYDASTGKMDTSDSYEGYKQEAKGLGKEAKDITGQFGEDATKLGAYQDKFDTMAGEAKTRGDKAEAFQQGQGVKYAAEAGKGQTAASEAAAGIKTATAEGQAAAGRGEAAAQTGVTAAGEGAAGYQAGAADVGAVKDRFGQEGFEKDVSGYESQIQKMGEKAMSGDVGQSQAAMLKGQMEEGRMASQKGSEEKLRRSMAQSGASPAEIASKVAQFQKSSAGQQAQAGRSEALSSQLQGQQMGQSQMGQAAGLMGQGAGMAGQRAGMAGQQASLGAQQAALRGQGAAMNMQGAQMGMSGAQMGMQGAQMGMQGAQQAGQMGMQGAQMGMSGVQGQSQMYAQGTQAGFQGAGQQADMMGRGIGAIQAAGGARQQQLGGIGVQAGQIDQQGQYTQAQLNDTMAQQTQAYSADEAEKTRKANASANSGGGGGGDGGLLSKIPIISDIRLKDNISLIKEGKDGDPNIYSFNYKWDSDTTWSGVMAQELLDTKHADAVVTNPEGYYMVDYGKLGISMTQLSTKEQHGI